MSHCAMRSGTLIKWLLLAFYLCWLEPAAGECDAEDDMILKSDDTVDAVGILGMKLMEEMSKTSEENIVFSPLVIASAMAMMYAGAAGDTEEQMKKVLKITKDYKNEYHSLLESSSSREGVTLNVANAVFTEKCIKIEDDFESDVECYFKGNVIDADFRKNSKNEKKIINSWIEEKTNGTIKDILPPNMISRNSSMELINAIYFKGEWDNKTITWRKEKMRDFHVSDNKTSTVRFMEITTTIRQIKREDSFILHLPYKGEEVSMYIVFPRLKGKTPLNTYMESVMENKTEFLDKLDYTKMGIKLIRLLLPKFKIEAFLSLRDVFKEIGMNLAFKEGKAEFTNLAKTDEVFISNAVHKAYIEVNESRTDKAPARSPDSFDIKVNRPFMFFIKDEMTGVILVQGAVRDPENV